MDVLIRYGFSIEEIKNMMDTNPEIGNIEDDVIYKLIDTLSYIGCGSQIIKNIFICNPLYLSRNINDVNDLIDKLKEIGIINLNILFDSNPYLLNLNIDDIDKIYSKYINDGLSNEQIIEKFNYNSFWMI